MESALRVIGIVGSPDRRGRTQDVVRQALAGAADGGATTELVFLSNYSLPRCLDCRPWTCRTTRRCKQDVDGSFAFLSDRVLAADAVVFGTPVYWGIESETAAAFIQRMHRTQAGQANGKPALGIAIAGGTGGGLVSGLRPVYHFFQIMGMRAIRPLPATKFNWPRVLEDAHDLGRDLVRAAREPRPFAGLERLAWYDDLPYLRMTRVEERVLLTEIVVEAVAGATSPEAESARATLAEAKRLLAAGQREEALPLVERAYADGVKAFDLAGLAAGRG